MNFLYNLIMGSVHSTQSCAAENQNDKLLNDDYIKTDDPSEETVISKTGDESLSSEAHTDDQKSIEIPHEAQSLHSAVDELDNTVGDNSQEEKVDEITDVTSDKVETERENYFF